MDMLQSFTKELAQAQCQEKLRQIQIFKQIIRTHNLDRDIF